MRREPRRWRTRFGSWVRGYGVHRLAQGLRDAGQPVTETAIYNWLGGRHVPRADSAIAIVSLSRGRVQVADVLRHRALLAAKRTETNG